MRGRLGRGLGRVWYAWVGVELSAAILALCLLVAVLPGIECLLALPTSWSWTAALGASANGGMGALLLGRRALALPAELLAAAVAPSVAVAAAPVVPAARPAEGSVSEVPAPSLG